MLDRPDQGKKVFSTKWQTSPRQYGIIIERNVAIPVREAVTLDSDIFRPDADGKFPALLAVHAYPKEAQSSGNPMPIGFSYARGFMETGDFNFYVRRGYALLIINITGTHKSGGTFGNIDPQSIQDVYEVVEWAARQPWCDGNVGMTGVSHFSRVSGRHCRAESSSSPRHFFSLRLDRHVSRSLLPRRNF